MTYGTIEIGNSDHIGWYLLSAATPARPLGAGTVGTSADPAWNGWLNGDTSVQNVDDEMGKNWTAPYEATSTFEQLLKDNFHIPFDLTKAVDNGKLKNKLLFGTNAYYFKHEAHNAKLETKGNSDRGDGWSASADFLQANWDTVALNNHGFVDGDKLTFPVGNIGTSQLKYFEITPDGNNTMRSYARIPIDMRKGYWVYIVQNNPVTSTT